MSASRNFGHKSYLFFEKWEGRLHLVGLELERLLDQNVSHLMHLFSHASACTISGLRILFWASSNIDLIKLCSLEVI